MFLTTAILRSTQDKLVVPVLQGLDNRRTVRIPFGQHGSRPTGLKTRSVEDYLSSVPKFLREKLRGFAGEAEGPLAGWIPAIPVQSLSASMAKSLRRFSMLFLSFSEMNASDNKRQKILYYYYIRKYRIKLF